MYEKPPKPVTYGTAGFRTKADVLPTVMYRVGLLAALRSRVLNSATIGVMITASHNPPEDNGAKLVDPLGDMLEQSWEVHATRLANAQSAAEADSIIESLATEFEVDPSSPAKVIYGRDTRASGPMLCNALKDGLERADAHLTDVGLVTTPQLHYLVRALNTLGQDSPIESYGVPTQDGYYRKLGTALRASLVAARRLDKVPLRVSVDCANGVGALKLREMAPILDGMVDIQIVNDHCDKPELLNKDCGADYVKTLQRLPANVSIESARSDSKRLCASFDGDADRVVCYYCSPHDDKFHLLDGDKIATLAVEILKRLSEQTGTRINIGVVQTAYANGASTEYITNTLKVPVVCTPTGVKHLHHAAQQFGIGVYFEANGHGTVLFEDSTVTHLREQNVSNPAQKRAVDTLLALSDLINQTVGDAISDLLLVLATLSILDKTPDLWDSNYTDLPNRLLKVEVRDRTMFKTTDAERKLVEPAGVQDKLNALMKKYGPRGRTFVRASGTEDVVRVYAEADTPEATDALANEVAKLLEEFR